MSDLEEILTASKVTIDRRNMLINGEPVPMYQYVAFLEQSHKRALLLLTAIEGVLALHRIVLVDALDGNGNGIYECNECHYEPDGHEECPTVALITEAFNEKEN